MKEAFNVLCVIDLQTLHIIPVNVCEICNLFQKLCNTYQVKGNDLSRVFV